MVVHKDITKPLRTHVMSACGLKLGFPVTRARFTRLWEEVTCKTCLRKRPKAMS